MATSYSVPDDYDSSDSVPYGDYRSDSDEGSPVEEAEKKRIEALKHLDSLSNDFNKLLENNNEYDAIIEVDEDSSNQKFKVHSAVLYCRCSYLYKRLKDDSVSSNEDKKDVRKIKLSQISTKAIDIIIKYIYSGIVDFEKLENSTIFDLWSIANEFALEGLAEGLELHLVENQASWLRLKFSKIHRATYQIKKPGPLRKFCDDIIAKHPNLIFESEDFLTLPENALLPIIKRDDLQVEEAKIWDHVIRWGIAQNSNLPPNVENWTDKNFLTLKTTLQRCLPHIRYFQLSKDDVMDRLFPFQQILGTTLWADILKHSMTPNKLISSTILPPRKIQNVTLPLRPVQIDTSQQQSQVYSYRHIRKSARAVRNRFG